MLPYVLSTRIRLARNLKNFRFPHFAPESELQAVSDHVYHAVKTGNSFPDARVVFLGALSALDRRVLEEKSLISPLLASQSSHRLVIMFQTSHASILVNEEDHLRIQAIRPGLNLKSAWKIVKKLEFHLQEKLDFAATEHYGYLTTCPSNAGPGIRTSVAVFVPGLIMLKRIIPIVKQCILAGYAVRGIYGEGSESRGYVLQISNQRPSEKNEVTVLKGLEGICYQIIEQEKYARLELLNAHRRAVLRHITEAEQDLRTMPQISLNTGRKKLAIHRLGIALGITTGRFGGIKSNLQHRDHELKRVDHLALQIQPAHILKYKIQQYQPTHPEASQPGNHDDEDMIRAELIQLTIDN